VRPLEREEFEQFRRLAHATFGLDLKPGKEELVTARLRRLAHAGGFGSFRDYYRHIVSDPTGESLAAMIDALATNHTAFLRESEHFEFLRREVAPRLERRDSIDVWSAACSTGEEAWSLAFVLSDALPAKRIRICATDISRKALDFAARACYPAERCRELPAAWLSRYFSAEPGPAKRYRVASRTQSLVAFRRLNLLGPYAWPRPFAVILCRNVMIYFDRATQEKVVRQLEACLEPGGYLLVGHAESLTRVSHSLEYVKPAVYRKAGRDETKWNRS